MDIDRFDEESHMKTTPELDEEVEEALDEVEAAEKDLRENERAYKEARQ